MSQLRYQSSDSTRDLQTRCITVVEGNPLPPTSIETLTCAVRKYRHMLNIDTPESIAFATSLAIFELSEWARAA